MNPDEITAGSILQIKELENLPLIIGQGEIPNYLEIQETDADGVTKIARLFRGELLLIVDNEDMPDGALVADGEPYRMVSVGLGQRISESLQSAI